MIEALHKNGGTAYPHSYYSASCEIGAATPRLQENVTADVCIVGGGYTGSSAALHLAGSGVRVVLLEKERFGWGASGRNGGQVHVGIRPGQEWFEARMGRDDARHLWRMGLDARACLDELIARHRIDCDFTAGLLHVDHKRSHVEHSRRTVERLHNLYDCDHVSFVDESEVRSLVGSKGYFGGMLDRRGGHLHALKLALGLARTARGHGAQLFEHSPVRMISRRKGGWHVATPEGSVHTDRVILACNGYLQDLCPQVAARVMPINNYVAVTAPLAPERAQSIVRDGLAVSDSRFVVYYFRITADHRLLFGGGENYSYKFPADIAGFVRPHILKVFPQLADVQLDYAWGGALAVTPNRAPYVREVEPGLYNISGYCGLGVVLAPYFGKLVAQAITTGGADFDRLTRLPVPRFPGGRWLRWPTLVAAMSVLALRDRL